MSCTESGADSGAHGQLGSGAPAAWAWWERIGRPRTWLAPMVGQSEPGLTVCFLATFPEVKAMQKLRLFLVPFWQMSSVPHALPRARVRHLQHRDDRRSVQPSALCAGT